MTITEPPKGPSQKNIDGLFVVCAVSVAVVAYSFIALALERMQSAQFFFALEKGFWRTQFLYTLPSIASLILLLFLILGVTRIRPLLWALSVFHAGNLLLWILSETIHPGFFYFQLNGIISIGFLLFAVPELKEARSNDTRIRKKAIGLSVVAILLFIGTPTFLLGRLVRDMKLVTKTDSCVSAFGRYIHIPQGCVVGDPFSRNGSSKTNSAYSRVGGLICSTVTEKIPATLQSFLAQRFVRKTTAKEEFDYQKTHLPQGRSALYGSDSNFCSYSEKAKNTECRFIYGPDTVTHLTFEGKLAESDLAFYLRSEPCSNLIE